MIIDEAYKRKTACRFHIFDRRNVTISIIAKAGYLQYFFDMHMFHKKIKNYTSYSTHNAPLAKIYSNAPCRQSSDNKRYRAFCVNDKFPETIFCMHSIINCNTLA